MACTRIPFAALPWISGSHPLEKKKTDAERRVTVLEFAPGFADPSWCENGHAGLVLEGTLELETTDGVVRCSAGDAFVVDRGSRHRARNQAATPVRLFVHTF
ncbi:MAG: cupin domain-containing protein [Pseudomonadota bacterium]